MKRIVLFAGTCLAAAGVLAACAGVSGSSGSGGNGGYGGAPGSAPASADTLVGTWVVDGTFETPTKPYLTIIEDGSWRGSDGCNGVEGTWELSDGGKLEVTAGPTTQIFCEDGKPLPDLFTSAATVSVDDSALTLFNEAGDVTAELMAGREEITPAS